MIDKNLQILENVSPDALHRDSDAAAQLTSVDDSGSQRRAAVMIPLVYTDAQWQLLFIRRADNKHDRHSGQVAFPGGSHDAEDPSLTHTALRETHEEIGVHPERIKLMGQLDPYMTISNFRVTPIVGVLQWPSNLCLQTSEVARAFLIPLAWLRDQDNFTMRARSDMDPQTARRHPIVVYNEFDGEVLWGATARMTLNFIKALDENALLLPPVRAV